MARLRVRLTFPPALIQEPIVYRLVKDFDIVINIRRADVKADHGWIALELAGDEGALERGVKWLKERRVPVDPIQRDVIVPHWRSPPASSPSPSRSSPRPPPSPIP